MNHKGPGKRNPLVELQFQYELLQKEYEYEREMYRLQTEKTGIHRKIKQGFCWFPVRIGKSYYNSLDQLVIELEKQDGTDLEHHFEPGRPITFFTTDISGSLRYVKFSATISYVAENKMVAALPSPAALIEIQNLSPLGIQLYFDETSYKTMFRALSEVMRAKGNRLEYLRNVLLGNQEAATRELFPIRFPWLNTSQDAAVNKVLAAKDVYIVHGPPGTGKTTTLVEAVFETLHRENQVMVSAQSNIAVDWISEKLVDRGVSVLRIGNPTRVNDKMLSFTYERKFESHPLYPELWGIRKAIREIQSSLRKRNHEEKETIRNRLSKLKFRATELEIEIQNYLFAEARVIACTLVGSVNRVLDNHTFTTLFIDEAAQALEAACWIPITKADRVIFAGDHQQLPPTIKNPEALHDGLGYTLMEKIVDRKPASVSLLQIQYRMQQHIMGFPSRAFYQNKLIAAPEVKDRTIFPYETSVIWVDTKECGYDEEQEENMSRLNRKEAVLTVLQLKLYMEQIGKQRLIDESIDFGVISPYKSQVYHIRRLIRREPFFRPYRSKIAIHTVDGFQGQERDVILISMVRSNKEKQIGFLSDLRRMNVAITRARMKLFIIGNSDTIQQTAFYKELYQYVMKHGRVIPIAGN